MTRFLITSISACFLLVACKREQPDQSGPSGKERPAATRTLKSHPQTTETTPHRPLAELPAKDQITTLTERLYQEDDNRIEIIVDQVFSHPDPDQRQRLFLTLYEETQLRPDAIRLPLILELARQPELEQDLRATIMAELGTLLQTDHGTMWSHWALALNEHLSQSEGVHRVD